MNADRRGQTGERTCTISQMKKDAKLPLQSQQTAPASAVPDTKERLLKAAKELFVRKGFSGVSIREIAREADANSALISYYFGDKEGLFKGVLESFVRPLNATRMAQFSLLENQADITVEEVVRAWVAPMFLMPKSLNASPVVSLSLTLSAEYDKLSEQIILDLYDEMNECFLRLLERCLPTTSRTSLVWRLYFLVGAALTASRPRAKSVQKLTHGMVDHQDTEEMVHQLVQFASAGFKAIDMETSKPHPKKR
jgi:AcrR family transcriptional regulator